jgi:uncharacterized protein YbaP (TraB family)
MKSLFLLLLLPLSLLAQRTKPEHELLWEISGNGLKKRSYLFGSFHSNDKRLFELSDSTFVALHNADMVVLETDIFSLFAEWDTRVSMFEIDYDNEGHPYVSDPYPTETYYGDEDGMPQFLDAFFEQYCWNAGKQFEALESIDFQLSLLDEFEGTDLSTLQWGYAYADRDEMLNTYLRGNINALDQVLRNALSYFPEGYEKLITERNYNMVKGLDSLLRTGQSSFTAVGAGHLAGLEGMISLLRKKGYTLRKVLATYSEEAIPARKQVFSEKTYTYVNDTLGLRVVFPGKPLVVTDDYASFDLKLIYRDFGQGNSYEVEIYPSEEGIGLRQLADIYIASPAESPAYQIVLEEGGEAWEGLADSYPEGLYWARIALSEESFVVIKAYGGNKFMNSKRPQRFFDQVYMH